MVPTPRALVLGGAIGEAMTSIDTVFSEQSAFDPQTASRVFRILGSDYFSTMLMPELSRRVLAQAPNVLLQFLDGGSRAMPHVLSEGTIDLALSPPVNIPGWAAFQFLFKSRLAMVAKRGMTALAEADVAPGTVVPLDLFCSLPQAICSTDGGLSTAIDDALAAHGRRRRIALTMPHFHALALAVAHGDVVGSLPVQFAQASAKSYGLDLYELPVGGEELDMGMYWHRRYDSYSAHGWLRGQVRTVLQEPQ